MRTLNSLHFGLKLISVLVIGSATFGLLPFVQSIAQGNIKIADLPIAALLFFSLLCSLLAVARNGYYLFIEALFIIFATYGTFYLLNSIILDIKAEKLDQFLVPGATSAFFDWYNFFWSPWGASGFGVLVLLVAIIRFFVARKVGMANAQ